MRPPAPAKSCLRSQAAARPMDFARQPPQAREPSPYNKSLYMYTYRLRFSGRSAPPAPPPGLPPAPPPHRSLPRALVAGQGPPSRALSKHALHPPPGAQPCFLGRLSPLGPCPRGPGRSFP